MTSSCSRCSSSAARRAASCCSSDARRSSRCRSRRSVSSRRLRTLRARSSLPFAKQTSSCSPSSARAARVLRCRSPSVPCSCSSARTCCSPRASSSSISRTACFSSTSGSSIRSSTACTSAVNSRDIRLMSAMRICLLACFDVEATLGTRRAALYHGNANSCERGLPAVYMRAVSCGGAPSSRFAPNWCKCSQRVCESAACSARSRWHAACIADVSMARDGLAHCTGRLGVALLPTGARFYKRFTRRAAASC